MAKVWLITGSGNGLGRDIAEAALAAGDSVVAGARRLEELQPLVRAVRRAHHAREAGCSRGRGCKGRRAEQLWTRTVGLDVLVNNAGYGHFAPFEQMTSAAVSRRGRNLPVRRGVHHATRHCR